MSVFEGQFVNDGTPQAFPDHLSQSNQEVTPANIALFKAAKAGSMGAVQKALSNGAKPNFFFNPEDSKNALHIASEEGHIDVVNELLANGAVPDCLVVSSKDTALTLACRMERNSIADTLIKAGADINHANMYGNTSLHECVREDFLGLANELMAAGADVRVQNHKGSSALHFLCYSSREETADASASQDLARALISGGADVNVADKEGLTPFLVCCASGRVDLMGILIEAGADTSVKDNHNRFAAEVATFYHHPEIAARFSKK
jgi:ankyrin repeat protein